MTDPAYPLTNGSGCSRGSPVSTTPGTGTPEAPALACPSSVSCCVAHTGQSPSRTTLPAQVSPPWSTSPPDKPRDCATTTHKPRDRASSKGTNLGTLRPANPGFASVLN